MSRSTCSPNAGFDEVSVDDVARRRGSRAARCSATTRRRTPSPGATSTRTSSTCVTCSTPCPTDAPDRSTRCAPHCWRSTASTRRRRRGTDSGCGSSSRPRRCRRYSMTMYAGWRAVVAEFVARDSARRRATWCRRPSPGPMLGVALSAYEHWLADESVSLAEAHSATRSTRSGGLAASDPRTRRRVENNSRIRASEFGAEATIRV